MILNTKRFAILGMAIASLGLSGCVGAGVGAGAAIGMESAKEGGLPAAVNDIGIQTQINSLWFQHDVDMFRKLDLTVDRSNSGIIR